MTPQGILDVRQGFPAYITEASFGIVDVNLSKR